MRRDEQGSATIFVIGFAIVLFLCAGLVIDGGLAINKRMRIADYAEQTARIGADSIDIAALRAGDGTAPPVIDEGLARQRMNGYLADIGYSPQQFDAQVGTDRVSVTIRDTSKTYILGLIGQDFPVVASAEAVPDTGPATNGQTGP